MTILKCESLPNENLPVELDAYKFHLIIPIWPSREIYLHTNKTNIYTTHFIFFLQVRSFTSRAVLKRFSWVHIFKCRLEIYYIVLV